MSMATTVQQQLAIQKYPDLARLLELHDAGWRFRTVPADDGQIDAVLGMRMWRTQAGPLWADMFQIRNVTDAAAVRLTPNKELVWRYTGGLTDTVDGLRGLAHPDHPCAPRLVIPHMRMPFDVGTLGVARKCVT